MRLSKEEFQTEANYQLGVYLVQKMLENKIITEAEYHAICVELLTAFPAVIGSLLLQK